MWPWKTLLLLCQAGVDGGEEKEGEGVEAEPDFGDEAAHEEVVRVKNDQRIGAGVGIPGEVTGDAEGQAEQKQGGAAVAGCRAQKKGYEKRMGEKKTVPTAAEQQNIPV